MSLTFTQQKKPTSTLIPAKRGQSEHQTTFQPLKAEEAPPQPGFGHEFGKVDVLPRERSGPQFSQSCSLSFPSPRACPFGGACHTCPAPIQAKLTISQPGDKYEQEADRVADQVMAMPEPQVQRECSACEEDQAQRQPEEEEEEVSAKLLQRQPEEEEEEEVSAKLLQRQPEEEEEEVSAKLLQRQPEEEEEEEETVSPQAQPGRTPQVTPTVSASIQSLRSGGQPLTETSRAFFEPRFGHDFSRVRVHADSKAANTAKAVRARAFTIGRDIVFGRSQYAPDTQGGRQLLAHELAHSIQQGAAGAGPLYGLRVGGRTTAAPSVQRDLAIPPPSPEATARILTEAEITSAIEFNRKHFKDPKSLENIRDIIGISPTPAVSDRELALTVAQWQAEFNLTVDGKAGDRTVGTIVRELKAEHLTPEGLKLLLDLHRHRPAGRATLNFLPVLQDLAPPAWGLTTHDDPIFDISVYARPGVWRCVITKADQQSHQGSRLPPGVVEVTPALVAAEANCARLQTMITSLNSVANQGAHSGFYMLAAVQAHENVHVTNYRATLPPHYTTLRTAIEALTVPLTSHNTARAAEAAIKALPAYTAAMATFHAADVAVNNAANDHVPLAPFNTAEHGVVDPMITTIGARRTALGCPP